MQANTNPVNVAAIIIILIFVSILPSHPAGLDPEIRNAIVLAYLNGYVDALQLDIETIKKLQKDKDRLRQEAERATLKYITLVEKMNE